MAQHTILYTDKVNPHTNKIIGSFVGERADRPGFTYVLEVAPAFRWRKYPNFAASGTKYSLSDKAGQEPDFEGAIVEAFAVIGGDFVRGRLRYWLAQSRLNILHDAFEQGRIPPMFDPDVESD